MFTQETVPLNTEQQAQQILSGIETSNVEVPQGFVSGIMMALAQYKLSRFALSAALAFSVLFFKTNPASAQTLTCTEIATMAKIWLKRNPGSNAYTLQQVQAELRNCLSTGYWNNLSKSGGQSALKQ
jgi:hypothetical protein